MISQNSGVEVPIVKMGAETFNSLIPSTVLQDARARATFKNWGNSTSSVKGLYLHRDWRYPKACTVRI